MTDPAEQRARDWWQTAIIDVEPGSIRIRGYPIEQLIGELDFPQMIWLMLRGEVPEKAQSDLLGAMLVAGVDHGPQAPSIAIARMAMTCGIGINGAIASASNVLGDVHGGAGEQLMELLAAIQRTELGGTPRSEAVREHIDKFQTTVTKYVPGFGHRFHPRDPRGPRLLHLVEAAREAGVVEGHLSGIAQMIGSELEHRTGRHLTMNIDGSGAVVLAELGFPPILGRGLFVLSRSVGIMAHAFEQHQQGGRNKGPIPREWIHSYIGPQMRNLHKE